MRLKTSKSAKKRIVKVTSTGKIILRRMSAQHRMKGKSRRTKLKASSNFNIEKANEKIIKKLIPYR